jgi:Fe-S oxidoreductase
LNELLPENGFNVARALVGSEGTLVTILQATVRLVYWPPAKTLVVLGYPNIYQAADHLMEVLESDPIALEGLDHFLVEDMNKKHLHIDYVKLLPSGKGWLMVQFGGETKEEADAKGLKLMARLKTKPNAPSMKLFDSKEEEEHVWKVRESGLGATAFVPGQPPTWEGWEDSAVAPEKVGAYLRDLCKLYEKYGYEGALYGHFGQGCIHTRITFDFFTAEGIKKYTDFMDEATSLVTSYGGSLSGEHGDGQSKAQFLVKMFGPELIQAFREFKSVWDPEWKMNPGKVVDPYRIDQNLRLGTDYNPPMPETHFHYTKDGGSFANATLRCVGVGECRRHHDGIMCPSYRATMEEKHSTRGRAHLLWEMMNGDVIKDGWKSEAVFDALDLCLACKGCKNDCPLNVDMATYKAEFLSHYYEGKRRPRHAYSMGLIYWWARLASLAPDLVNFVTQMPGLSNLAKFVGGIAQQRSIPKFASVTFKDWFRKRGVKNPGGPAVILWADTFNNYFHPEIAAAAVEVLEAAGCRVLTPGQSLCCGRPLYDFGMLDIAEKLLAEILAALRPHIQEGTPVVGLEPSCVAVFRDEMPDLFPHDKDAKRLSGQIFTLAEFLEKKIPHYHPPKLERKALVHGHCHQRSVLGFTSEPKLYGQMGLDHQVLDDTCCGMAGSFGFEEGKYDVSMKVGELGVLKKVREAPKDTLILADGFSCRTQIEQGSDRRALHTAQVLKMALEQGAAGPKGAYPERKYQQLHGAGMHPSSILLTSIAAGAALGGGLLLWNSLKSRERV